MDILLVILAIVMVSMIFAGISACIRAFINFTIRRFKMGKKKKIKERTTDEKVSDCFAEFLYSDMRFFDYIRDLRTAQEIIQDTIKEIMDQGIDIDLVKELFEYEIYKIKED